jgi:hypothetical protein
MLHDGRTVMPEKVPPIGMDYSLRRTWPHSSHRENDYVVRFRRHSVGRMYLATLPNGNRWRWAIFINEKVNAVASVPTAGYAPNLEVAIHDFQISFEKMRRTQRFLAD